MRAPQAFFSRAHRRDAADRLIWSPGRGTRHTTHRGKSLAWPRGSSGRAYPALLFCWLWWLHHAAATLVSAGEAGDARGSGLPPCVTALRTTTHARELGGGGICGASAPVSSGGSAKPSHGTWGAGAWNAHAASLVQARGDLDVWSRCRGQGGHTGPRGAGQLSSSPPHVGAHGLPCERRAHTGTVRSPHPCHGGGGTGVRLRLACTLRTQRSPRPTHPTATSAAPSDAGGGYSIHPPHARSAQASKPEVPG